MAVQWSNYGDVQQNGMVLLKDPNLKFRHDIEPKRRFRQTARAKQYLGKLGYKTVNSSNVSALRHDGINLWIRFLNGSVYLYPGSAELFDKIMQSMSKGRAVWNYIRRANVPYQKVDDLPLPEDTKQSDFELLNIDLFNMGAKIEVQPKPQVINGSSVYKMIIDGETIFVPLLLIKNTDTKVDKLRKKSAETKAGKLRRKK